MTLLASILNDSVFFSLFKFHYDEEVFVKQQNLPWIYTTEKKQRQTIFQHTHKIINKSAHLNKSTGSFRFYYTHLQLKSNRFCCPHSRVISFFTTPYARTRTHTQIIYALETSHMHRYIPISSYFRYIFQIQLELTIFQKLLRKLFDEKLVKKI